MGVLTPQDQCRGEGIMDRDMCDCRQCYSGSFIGIGNPPHGWFRLAQYNLATQEDSYLWCCARCHTLVFDRGGWEYLRMHQCPVGDGQGAS